RVERADDASDGAEQSEQRRNRRDRAQRVDITLELVHDVAPGVLEALHENFTGAMAIGETRREQLAQRGVLLESGTHLVVDLLALDELPDLLGQLVGQYAPILKRPQPLENDGGRCDRTQNDRPHQRATGPHDFPHPSDPNPLTTAAYYRSDEPAQGDTS